MGLLFMVIFYLGRSEVILLRMVLEVDIEVLGEIIKCTGAVRIGGLCCW